MCKLEATHLSDLQQSELVDSCHATRHLRYMSMLAFASNIQTLSGQVEDIDVGGDTSASIASFLAELLEELEHCESMARPQSQRFAHCNLSRVVLEDLRNVGVSSLCTMTYTGSRVAPTFLKIRWASATSIARLLTHRKVMNEARSRWDNTVCSSSFGIVLSVARSLLLGERVLLPLSG